MQPVAADRRVGLAQPDSSHDDVVTHRSQYPCTPVTRLCIACGIVRDCDPSLECGECGASVFHLIPLRSHAA